MNFHEIQEFLRREGGKVLIVENGQPAMVIFSYADYMKRGNSDVIPRSAEAPSAAFAQEHRRERGSEATQDLTIDDLPL